MAAWPFRGNKGDFYTKITSDTNERIIVPGYEGFFTNLRKLIIANTSASVCKVTIKSAQNGNVRTVIQVPANNTISVDFPDDTFEELSKNSAWTATCGSSVDSIEITAFFKND